jgi:hypothetical protein
VNAKELVIADADDGGVTVLGDEGSAVHRPLQSPSPPVSTWGVPIRWDGGRAVTSML